jgi:iron complex transport system ATP-binding protein
MLSVDNLSVELGGKEILRGESVSFSLRPGEVVGLLGPNGSGKSTLLKAIAGLVKKRSGKIHYGEYDADTFTSRRRARVFAYVPQSAAFSSAFTVLESVVMGRFSMMKRFEGYSKLDYEIASEALARTGLAGFENRIVTALSGGEAERVLIARALAQDSPVFLLDEPMASLDPKYSIIISRLVRELADEGRIALMVMHDVNLAVNGTTRLLFLRSGRIIGDIKTTDIDEDALLNLSDIPWELWSVGENNKIIAVPRDL